MLDQNTDRMWFVIGAVIVGAAIIFIANGTLPDLFASVSGTMEDSVDMWQTSHYVNDVKGNMISHLGMYHGYYPNVNTGEISDKHEAQDYSTTSIIDVVSGETYVFSTPNNTYKYIQYYESDGTPILRMENRGSVEAKGQYLETVVPEGVTQVRLSTRKSYTTNQHAVPQEFAEIDTWWFGLKSDFEG